MEAALQATKAKERQKIKKFDEVRKFNLWLRHIKWQAYITKLNGEKLQELISPVKDNKPKLQVLYKAFN